MTRTSQLQTPSRRSSPFGTLLQHWRQVRRLSQLALAIEADVSPRHVCFIETGRASPSRDMVLLLASALDREAVGGAPDEATACLLEEILAFPGVPRRWQRPSPETPLMPVIPVSFGKGSRRFAYFSTVTTLGTAQDVTLQELRIECFFPMDAETERNAEELARGG